MTGLFFGDLNPEKLITINNLKEVTSPIFLDRNVPTADGVLSYEIFGTSQKKRKYYGIY